VAKRHLSGIRADFADLDNGLGPQPDLLADFDETMAEHDLEIKLETLKDARKVISQYLATAEKWRYDRVMWAFAIMLNEIPEDTPCPEVRP